MPTSTGDDNGSDKTLGVVESASPVTGFMVVPETDNSSEVTKTPEERILELEKQLKETDRQLKSVKTKLSKTREHVKYLQEVLNDDYEQDEESYRNPLSRDPNAPPPIPTEEEKMEMFRTVTPPSLSPMMPPPLPGSQQETVPIQMSNPTFISPIDPNTYQGSLEPEGLQALNADIHTHNENIANGNPYAQNHEINNSQAQSSIDDTRPVTPPPLPTPPPPLQTTPPSLPGFTPAY